MTFDRQNAIVAAIVAVLVVVAVTWAIVNVNRADRHADEVRFKACETIEDDATRALCLKK